MDQILRLGCFEGWENRYTMILFSGNKEAISKLEQIFHNLSQGIVNEIRFDQQEFVKIYSNIELKGQLAEKDKGLSREDNTNSFTICLSSDTWDTFADLISVFRDGKIGHHYLDCHSKDGTKFMVSMGEYSDNWVGWKQ